MTKFKDDWKPVDWRSSSNLFFSILFTRLHVRLFLMTLGTLFAATGISVAFFQKEAIDLLTSNSESLDYHAIIVFFVGAFLLLALNKSIEVSVRIFGLRESNVIETYLSRALYEKSLNLHYEKRGERSTGETIALMANHLSMISFFFTELFPPIFTTGAALLFAPLAVGILFEINPIGIYCVVAFSIATCLLFARRSSSLFQRYKKIDEQRLGYINEWLRNIKTLKSLSWQEVFEHKIFKKTEEFTKQRIKMTTWAQFMNAFAESLPHLMNAIGVTTLVFFSAPDLSLTPGKIFGMLWILAVFMYAPMKILPWIFVISLDANASLKRIHAFLNEEEQEGASTQDKENTETELHVEGGTAISVEGLELNLGGLDVLKNISFEIETGSLVAIVGEVGAGKTQLLHSLVLAAPAKFRRFQIFGTDISPKDQSILQGVVSLAPQDAFTLSESISKNVHFNFTESSDEVTSAKKSLSLAAYDEDLSHFRDGVQTELGEFGINLSGGQKQRLALARAHYYERPVVLLDDSLSAVDTDTENWIVDKLIFGEWKQRTRLLVTHRLNILPKCDKILYLDHGKLVAAGTWEDLRKNSTFLNFVSTLENEDA